MNRIDKTFTRLGKKQSTQITKTRSERVDITSDATEIKRSIETSMNNYIAPSEKPRNIQPTKIEKQRNKIYKQMSTK